MHIRCFASNYEYFNWFIFFRGTTVIPESDPDIHPVEYKMDI